MDITIQTSPRIRELISNGVITVGVHITRDGNDVWARTVQPHPRLGVPSSTSYTLEEIEEKLKPVLTRPSKKDAMPTHPDKLIVQAAEGSLGFHDVEEAIAFARKNLREIVRNGVRNKLPLDSLVPSDFDRSRGELFARIAVVGANLTSAKLASRINSQRDLLFVKNAVTLEEWWDMAGATQKVMLLLRSKHLSWKDSKTAIPNHWLDKLETMPFPFRKAETQVGQEEGRLSAEEGDSSDDNLPKKAEGVTLTKW